MIKCVNINHPDFDQLLKDSGMDPIALSAEMGVWMEENNTDEWPTLEQLGIIKKKSSFISDRFKDLLSSKDDIVIKDIEQFIKGLANTFSSKKYGGHYTVRRDDIMQVGFNQAQRARDIVAEINRIVPDLLYLQDNPIYYRNQQTGQYLINKDTGERVARGDVWTKVIISETALKRYLASRSQLSFDFDQPKGLSEDDVKSIEDTMPEFKGLIGDTLPIEFDQFENPEADPRLVNLIYAEAKKVGELLDAQGDTARPMALLDAIEDKVGLSEVNAEHKKLIQDSLGDLADVEFKIIKRIDLHSLAGGAFRKHIHDYGFTHISAKDNTRTIYLIKDNLDVPGHGTFDLLASTILHELYHGILFNAIDNPTSEAEHELSREVNKLFKAAKSQTAFTTHAAYKNVQEFVSYGLTNHRIVSELKDMKYNWWQRFIRAIVNFFIRFTDAGEGGKSLTYYDSLYNAVFGYISKQRTIKPVLNGEVTLAAGEPIKWLGNITGLKTTYENAKLIANNFNRTLKSYHNFLANVPPNEAEFITTEHGQNIMGFSGVPSDLIAKQKDLSKLKYNNAYATIREAVMNYEGRAKIVDKEALISRLENKFGKNAAVVTNVFVHNIDRRMYDVIDFVVVHSDDANKGPIVYSFVDFYESNGEMSTFEDVVKLDRKKGLYKPMAWSDRLDMRLSWANIMFKHKFYVERQGPDVSFDAYSLNVIPIAEDNEGNATLDGDITEVKMSGMGHFFWRDSFDKARAQAFEEYQSDIDIELSDEVEDYTKEYFNRIELEMHTLKEDQKLVYDAIKMLHRRGLVSRAFGRRLATVEISGLLKTLITEHEEPQRALTSLVEYIYKELTKTFAMLQETDMQNKKINKNTLTAFYNMTKSFEIINDIASYFMIIEKDTPELKTLDLKIKESISCLAYIKTAYKNRAINLLVDFLAPYYSRIKNEQLEKYANDYRRFKYWLSRIEKGDERYTKYDYHRRVPSNFNPDLTEEEYVASQYKKNEKSINDSTRLIIAEELVKGQKDIAYLAMLVDNILDTDDAVVGAFVKALSTIDDEIRLDIEEKRSNYFLVLEDYERYMTNSRKAFTNYMEMYDFMLSRDPKTGKYNGYIITQFSPELLKKRDSIFAMTELYDEEEKKFFRSTWLNHNMPVNYDKYLDALLNHIKSLAESGKITEAELKHMYNHLATDRKYFDVKFLLEKGYINEDIANDLYEWIGVNRDLYREPAEEWITDEWRALSKILEDKDDPRSQVYNAIIEMRDLADSMVPASRGIKNRLPGVIKQKEERVGAGQPVGRLIADSLRKTFTFQVDDTHRHNEIITEGKEALYFLPVHYNKPVVKVIEEDGKQVIRFDEENQSFDLFSIYFSYLTSAISYSKKRTVLAEIDMMKNLLKVRELPKKASLTSVLKRVKDDPSDILKMGYKEQAVKVGGNIYEMFNTWVNAIWFGQYSADVGKIFGLDAGKIAEFIKKYTAVKLLGLNVIQGVANVTLGEFQQWNESITGEFFKAPAYGKAHLDYLANLPGIVADLGSRKPRNILSLLGQHFDLMDMPEARRLGKRSRIGWLSLTDFAQSTNTAGENFMKFKFMSAMLYQKRAYDKDGNDIGSIRDFYTTKSYNKKGEEVDPHDNPREVRLTKLVFDPEGKVDLVKSTWTPADRNDFKQRLEGLLGRIHGDWSNLARATIQHHPWVSMLYMFRRFIPPGFRRHWGKHRYETRNLQSVEGMYISTFNFLFKPFVDAFRAKRNLDAEINDIIPLTWGERWAMLSDHQRANIGRTALEIVDVAMIMLLYRLLAGDDDDELSYADEFLIYQLLRLKSEILFFISPGEAMKILRSPMASMSVFEDLAKFAQQAMNPFEVYESGPWDGQLKIYRRLVSMIPIYRQAYRLRDVGDQIPYFQRPQ